MLVTYISRRREGSVMEHKQGRGNAAAAVALLGCLISLLMLESSTAYMIYRVGDDVGWTNEQAINYTRWASNKVFSVGDMLVFTYVANHTVIQTENQEAYQVCNISVDDARTWSSEGSTEANVLLNNEGRTYFFCSAWDSTHCHEGMKFGIDVMHGDGSMVSTTPSPQSPVPGSAPVISDSPPAASSSESTAGSASTSENANKSGATLEAVHCLMLLVIPIVVGALGS